MCETGDLGIKWPYWQTLIFGNDTKIGMRFVCPQDVKKMLVQRARSVYWMKWAAKNEYEELKEGAWLEPGLALLRKKVKENWTDKHRNVPGRFSWKVDGRKKDYWILTGRTSVIVKPARQRKERKTQAKPLPRMVRSQTRDSRSFDQFHRIREVNFAHQFAITSTPRQKILNYST